MPACRGVAVIGIAADRGPPWSCEVQRVSMQAAGRRSEDYWGVAWLVDLPGDRKRRMQSRSTVQSVRIQSAERPNTLGLGPRELQALLDFLDSTDAPGKVRREFRRWPFRQTGVNVQFTHPGGSTTKLRLAGRNLSRGGISLLHNGFVHTGTRCEIELPRREGGPLAAPCSVTRCQHRRGMLHEIGFKFDKPVNLKEFLKPEGGAELSSFENAAPQKLQGRILHVEDNALDVRIVAHYLRETNLKILTAGNRAEAITAAAGQIDLLLVGYNLPDSKGTELVKELRGRGVTAHALIVTADPAASMGEGLWEIPATGLIRKPFTQEQLLCALCERLLITDGGDGAGHAAEMLRASAGQLRVFADELDGALRTNDLAKAKDVTEKLHGSAASLGLKALQTAADAAHILLPGLEALSENPRVVTDLAAACRQAAA
ncbi:hypothetical protein PHYC_02561 [Phycisphaerales bacterium]|nr:hypothetical protein PHYC_02561 [Phycisphaerales bacterium]